MSEPLCQTWNDHDPQSREKAFAGYAEAHDGFTGISKGHSRDYLNVGPNTSVKPGFGRDDYDAFRPGEAIPKKQKKIIKMCVEAYDKVGIVRNVIDLMGDFGCQGINLAHEDASVERFMQQWWKRVEGKERSERFLNNLYKSGQVFTYTSYADITPDIKTYIRSLGSDIVLEKPPVEKGTIPWRYNFFNPLSIDIKDGEVDLFLGRQQYELNTGPLVDNFQNGIMPIKVLDSLPSKVKEAMNKNDRKITLDPDRLSVHYYKKDDWQQWAHPLVYAILDDIVMLEKMKLSDLAALDGAISNIRLWTVGDFEHKVLPTKAGINKLRNILAGNTGGGTMELVYGPELKFTESNSQVYKFLGSEKYQSVLNSIYAGLGVPPTLTGMASGGGFTNNYISLKTLVERLQYGRDRLTHFWEGELEHVRKAMGFRKAAIVTYDQMSLSDEATEKNLLIQLADRDIISNQTVLERFKELPGMENVRLRREAELREKGKYPDKTGPFHTPPIEEDLEKMDKQHEQNLETQDNDLKSKEKQAALKPKPVGPGGQKKKPAAKNGRPSGAGDSGPRKKRVDTPKSSPGKAGIAELFIWASVAFDALTPISKAYLGSKGKSNMRQLTKDESKELEDIRLNAFVNLEPFLHVGDVEIHAALCKPVESTSLLKESLQMSGISIETVTMDLYKKTVVACYVESYLGEI